MRADAFAGTTAVDHDLAGERSRPGAHARQAIADVVLEELTRVAAPGHVLALESSLARHGVDAGRFLDAMAAEMTEAWADPATLSAVARARGVTDPVPRLQPEGFSRLNLALGGTQPLTLHMELVEAGPLPRWQVAAVSMPLALPVVPPARLAMR
jgi:hypothetical protein